MKTIISALTFLSVFTVAVSYRFQTTEKYLDIQNVEDAKVHFFVLMVPETSVQALRKKARQEEETGATITDVGEFVSQILKGVLTADSRNIFAGSTSFIPNQDVQAGVSKILENVAPTLNRILEQWVKDASIALGITTTGRPGSALLSNQTQPWEVTETSVQALRKKARQEEKITDAGDYISQILNGVLPALLSNQTQPSNNGDVIIGRPILTVAELFQYQLAQAQRQQQMVPVTSIPSGTEHQSNATTVQPLSNQTPSDQDDDDDGRRA